MTGARPPVTAASPWVSASEGLPPQPGVLSLAVAPSARAVLYASLIIHGVHRSIDGGNTWTSITNFPILPPEAIMSLPVSIVSLAADPAHPGTVYAGTSFAGVLTTRNSGTTWRSSNAGLEGRGGGDARTMFSVDALALAPSGGEVAYAAIRGRGVFRTANAGDSWSALTPTSHRDIHTLAVDPARPRVLYAGTLDGGAFKSNDGGKRWLPINRGLENRVVRTLVVHPRRPWVVFAGTYDGIFKSVDGGRSWRPASRGLVGARLVQAILVHPTRPRTVFAATRGGGVFLSTNGGARWKPWNAGLENRLVMTLGFDARASILYAGTLGGVFSRHVR